MIIILLVLASIIFFVCCNLFLTHHVLHTIGTIFAVVLILVSVGLSIANFRYHYGMHLFTESYSQYIHPSTKGTHILIYEPLGKDHKEQIITYRTSANQKKMQHTTLSSHVYNKICRTNYLSPRIQSTKRVYEYNSSLSKLMFGIAVKPQVHKTYNTFYVPKNWIVLSANQAKSIKKLAKNDAINIKKQNNNPQAKQLMMAQLQQKVQSTMMRALQKDPTMSVKKQESLQKNIINKAKNNAKNQMKKQIMAKAINQAQHIPVHSTK